MTKRLNTEKHRKTPTKIVKAKSRKMNLNLKKFIRLSAHEAYSYFITILPRKIYIRMSFSYIIIYLNPNDDQFVSFTHLGVDKFRFKRVIL